MTLLEPSGELTRQLQRAISDALFGQMPVAAIQESLRREIDHLQGALIYSEMIAPKRMPEARA